MVLPLRLRDLQVSGDQINYQVVSYSRDVINSLQTVEPVDQTPPLSVRLDAPVRLETGFSAPIFPSSPGDIIHVTFDRAAFAQQRSQGLLAIYLHNDLTNRTQAIPVAFDRLH